MIQSCYIEKGPAHQPRLTLVKAWDPFGLIILHALGLKLAYLIAQPIQLAPTTAITLKMLVQGAFLSSVSSTFLYIVHN